MERIYGYIYTITNKKNGKVYVGQAKNPKKRYGWHLKNARDTDDHSPLYEDMRKLGISTFSFNVEMKIPTTPEHYAIVVDAMEKAFIDRNDALIPNGYNRAYCHALVGESKENMAKHMPASLAKYWATRRLPKREYKKTEEQRAHMSSVMKANWSDNPDRKKKFGESMHKKIWVYHAETKKQRRIDKEQLSEFIGNGYVQGRPY